jgi:hypothetical protein
MRSVPLVSVLLLCAAAGEAAQKGPSVAVRPAPRGQFPGVVHQDANPQEPGDIDCSSPVHGTGE